MNMQSPEQNLFDFDLLDLDSIPQQMTVEVQRHTPEEYKNFYGYIGENYTSDDFAYALKKKHGIIAQWRTVPEVKTAAGDAVEYRYIHPTEGKRYAYALTFRPTSDEFYQHVLVFRHSIPPLYLAAVFEAITKRDSHDATSTSWRE